MFSPALVATFCSPLLRALLYLYIEYATMVENGILLRAYYGVAYCIGSSRTEVSNLLVRFAVPYPLLPVPVPNRIL
jgi:hypothetical protein